MFEGRDSHDGAGWVVSVDGEQVADGASIGALEEALRGWMGRTLQNDG